jgi:hypothetical protein
VREELHRLAAFLETLPVWVHPADRNEVVAAGSHQTKIKEFFADFDQFPYLATKKMRISLLGQSTHKLSSSHR